MTAPDASFSDGWDTAPAATGTPDAPKAVVDAPYGVNPRTGRPYTQSEEERKSIGARLAEARANRAGERGAKPGARNHLEGKSTRQRRGPKTSTPPKTSSKPNDENKAYKAVDKIVGWVQIGGAVLSAKDPVRGTIVLQQAEQMPQILRGLSDEYPQARAALESVERWLGPANAASDAIGWALMTASGLALTTGRVPGGIIGAGVAMVGGSVLDNAVTKVAARVEKETGVPASEVRTQIRTSYGLPTD